MLPPCNRFIFLFSGNSNKKGVLFKLVFFFFLQVPPLPNISDRENKSLEPHTPISYARIWKSCTWFLNSAANYLAVYILGTHKCIYIILMNKQYWLITCVLHWLCVCVLSMSFYSNALASWGLADLCPSHCWSFPTDNYFTASTLFIHKPSNRESHSPQLFLFLGLDPPVLITLGRGTRQLGMPPTSQAQWNYSN